MRQVQIRNSITALEVRLSLRRFSRRPLLLIPSVDLSYKARYTNWKKNVENRGKVSFTPASKVRLTLRRFSGNSSLRQDSLYKILAGKPEVNAYI
jgi:hypothetical protein